MNDWKNYVNIRQSGNVGVKFIYIPWAARMQLIAIVGPNPFIANTDEVKRNVNPPVFDQSDATQLDYSAQFLSFNSLFINLST